MRAILCADKNWGIGKNNKLLVSIPADMRFFRDTTSNHVVVMGRKTLESFPGGKPLKNRTNIVLSSNPNYRVPDAQVVHSKEELLEELKKYDTDEIYVIGGAAVYELMLPYCDTVYVTRVEMEYDADTRFPNMDRMTDWEMTEESEEQTYFDVEYRFCTYRKKDSAGEREA
uniref:dihydrofolate reductase n=1 Tax=Eubacterium cellulosolvens TaxID=29322 RepID=UPI00048563C6|nr:dihydrofolate reductase [[Eubacterium] cellulosolvens]